MVKNNYLSAWHCVWVFTPFSDCKINDRFKTELDDEPEQQFAEDRFNQVKTKSVHDGLSSEGKCRSQRLTSRSDWHCSAV